MCILLDTRSGCGWLGRLSCGHYSDLEAVRANPRTALFVGGR